MDENRLLHKTIETQLVILVQGGLLMDVPSDLSLHELTITRLVSSLVSSYEKDSTSSGVSLVEKTVQFPERTPMKQV